MAVFRVTNKDGTFEARCRSFGVVITGSSRDAVEAIARRTAAQRQKSATFRDVSDSSPTIMERLRRWLARPPGGGRRS
jgi:hypothetical protein